MLRAEPFFFRSLTKDRGVRRTSFVVENTTNQRFEGRIDKIQVRIPETSKPGPSEWLQLERVFPGTGETAVLEVRDDARGVAPERRADHPGWLVLEPRRSIQLVASVSTNHQTFPRARCDVAVLTDGLSGTIEVDLADQEPLIVRWTIGEVVVSPEPFKGFFAIDFGTSNTCFAFKHRRAGPAELTRQPVASEEIPSLIYFEKVGRQDLGATVLVGDEARLARQKHPSRVYAYLESVKRLLGSGRAVTVLDAEGKSARYQPEDLAAFLVHRVLDRAQRQELEGRRLERIVATFPTLSSPRRRRATQDALLKALQLLDSKLVDPKLLEPGPRDKATQDACDALVELRVDEANAATFDLVRGLIDQASFGPAVHDILAIDVGGGTTDVSFLEADVRFDHATQRTTIDTKLLGVTGDMNFAGDNVTLELVRLLRVKLATAAAEWLCAQEAVKAKQKETAEADPFANPWAISFKDLGKAAAPEAVAAPYSSRLSPDEQTLFTSPPLEKRLAWAALVRDHARVLLRACGEGILDHPAAAEGKDGWLLRLEELLAEEARTANRSHSPSTARALDEALEGLVPTRFGRHADANPALEKVARVFFMDLWREANDRLKPMLVGSCHGKTDEESARKAVATVQEPLERIAHYVDPAFDPKAWSQVSVTLAELEAMIRRRTEAVVRRARALVDGARPKAQAAPAPSAAPALDMGFGTVAPVAAAQAGAPGRAPKLTILLAGNSSVLPIVRRTVEREFASIGHELRQDTSRRKVSVAQGAVEEVLLAREFGKAGGGVHYRTENFIARLPFSVGLYSAFGAKKFWPLFERGAAPGTVVAVDGRSNPLVNAELEELMLYADYHDGEPVRYLGVVDFRRGTSEGMTSEDAKAVADAPTGVFMPRLRLLADWEIEYLHPGTRRVHRMTRDDPRLDPRLDPFAGVV